MDRDEFGFFGVFQTRSLLSHRAAKEGWSAADFRWPLREVVICSFW